MTAVRRLLVLFAFCMAFGGGFADAALAVDGAWAKQTSGTTTQLNAVFFIDETTGWAVGDDATVLHTTNGGGTWTAQSVPVGTDYDFTGVDFIDSTTGWIAADGPDLKVLRTQDGGATWVAATIHAGILNDLNDVDFFDAGRGVAGGLWSDTNFTRNYDLSISGDGGMTWDNIDFDEYVLGEPTIVDIEWADATNVWACGDTAFSELALLRSTDGGAHWSRVNTLVDPDGGEPSGNLGEVNFVDSMHGWAVSDFVADSASGNGPVMLFTSDGGATWLHRHWSELGLAAANRPSAIDFVDNSRGWMVGGGRSAWRTTDGGLTWEVVALPQSEILSDVDFVSESCGWAVGWNGAIYHYAIPDVPTDTTPPVTTASGYDDAWHKTPVTVSFAATDPDAGASGVAYTEYRLDAGAWTRGTSCTVPAPANTSHVYTVGYRSADVAGNVESEKRVQVKIATTTTPVTPTVTLKLTGLKRGAVTLGKRVTAKGRVTPTSLAGSKVKLQVQKKRGARWVTVKTVKRTISAAATYSWKYKPAKKGAYRMKATIAKTATNTAAKTPWRKFKVK